MATDVSQFLSANASAVFGLVGALGGALLSFFGAFLVKRREFSLQTWSKLSERRIVAHEKVISLAVEMRVMVGLGAGEDGEVRRAPQVLISKDEFDSWLTRFTQLTLEGTTWLTTQAKREVNYAQDYLVTLHLRLASIPSEQYLAVGEIVRQDFIDLSSSLEKSAFGFFQSEVHKLKLNSLSEHHKYKRPETERRLLATQLLERSAEIESHAASGGSVV